MREQGRASAYIAAGFGVLGPHQQRAVCVARSGDVGLSRRALLAGAAAAAFGFGGARKANGRVVLEETNSVGEFHKIEEDRELGVAEGFGSAEKWAWGEEWYEAEGTEGTERTAGEKEKGRGEGQHGTVGATWDDYIDAVKVGKNGEWLADLRVLLLRAGVVGFVAAFSATAMAVSDRESHRMTLPTRYDPAAVKRYFRIRPDKVLVRMALFGSEIALYLAGVAVDSIAEVADKTVVRARKKAAEMGWGAEVDGDGRLDSYWGGDEWAHKRRVARNAKRASALREGIIRLGPAVIKLGQAAASRPDILDLTNIRELQNLQDNILEYFPPAEAFELIREELGARPELVFDTINPEPVAGASLGMVFKATVSGVPVAVKVQRPGVAENIALDCYIVRGMAAATRQLFGYRTDLSNAVDEYASHLFEELDYTNEIRNMDKFRERYGHVKGIYIPSAFPKYSSRRVLVTEWVDGVKLIDADARVRTEDLPLVETGIRFALTQLLDEGYLHAVLRTKSGKLAYIDFGLVSEVPKSVRESIVCALMHLIHGEYTLLAESFSGLALMRSDDVEVDLPVLSEALREAFEPEGSDDVGVRSRNGDAEAAVGALRMSKFTLIGVVGKLLQLGGRFPFVFNDYFLNNLRCLGMLEGLALNADPNFSVLGIVYPHVVRKIINDPAPRYRHALESLIIDSYGRMRWGRMDQLLLDLEMTAAAAHTEGDDNVTSRTAEEAQSLAAGGETRSLSYLSSRFGAGMSEVARQAARQERLRGDGDQHSRESPDVLIRFMTSSEGRFLRRHVIRQHIEDTESAWRRGIDSFLQTPTSTVDSVATDNSTASIPQPKIRGDLILETTAPSQAGALREVTDDEARKRTRRFLKNTPLTRRVRVLLRLAPGIVGPVARMVLRTLAYAVMKLAFALSRIVRGSVRGTRQVARSEQLAARSSVGSLLEPQLTKSTQQESRASVSTNRMSEALATFEPFDSSFLRRTRQPTRKGHAKEGEVRGGAGQIAQ